MAPVVLLEVGGRAWVGWYSSLSEAEPGAVGAAGWVVALVVGASAAAAAAAERETLVEEREGRAVLFCLLAGGAEGRMVVVLVLAMVVVLKLDLFLGFVYLFVCLHFLGMWNSGCLQLECGRDATFWEWG